MYVWHEATAHKVTQVTPARERLFPFSKARYAHLNMFDTMPKGGDCMTLRDAAIRPRIPLWFYLLFGLFTVASLGLMVDAILLGDATGQLIVGLASTIVFGCCLAGARLIVWARPVTLTVQAAGIWYYFAGGRGLIPWQDIKKVGAVDVIAVKSLGVRLEHDENFRLSLVQTQADRLGEIQPYPSAKAERLLDRMQATRQAYGYDIVIPSILLDRSVTEMILMLDDQRRNRDVAF